jgi:hypothetical protein
VTVGEKNLKEGKIELKKRTEANSQLLLIEETVPFLKK